MGKSILKIKATSLVYNATENETYKDNVFIDDKYLENFDINKVRISVNSDTNDVLYALSSGFDIQVDSLASNKFSFMNVLHENYNDLKNDEISMQIRMREIGATIDSAREFITKVNATKELEGNNNVSFAGILFSTNKASILNTGKARIYLFRDKYLKLISAQPEQDNDINSRYDNSKVLSENFDVEAGDVYILCNEGSSGVISDDNIYEQLSQKDDFNQAISYLVKSGIAGSTNKNISMIAIEVQTVPTDVIFSEAAAFVAVNEVLGTGKPDSEKNRMISELLSANDKKPQEYTGAGVPFIGANRYQVDAAPSDVRAKIPFIGANRYQLDGYEEYGNEKEAKINKNMVAGVIALSLLLVVLLVMSGMMIYSFSKREPTYEGIIDTPQPTTEATIQPSSTSTAKPRTTKAVTVTTPTVKPKATKSPTPKPSTAALALAAATSAVRTAEATPTQGNVNKAQGLVAALPDGATKTDLQGKINAVQDRIDAAAAAAAATSAVETAEAIPTPTPLPT